MKMMTFSTLTLAFALVACGTNADSGADNGSVTTTEPTSAPASEATPQTDQVSSKHKNGIDEQNAGDATGKMDVNGTIERTSGGQVLLFVMEGRNKSEIARTAVNNGAFEFKNIEISRGVYTLAFNDDKNSTEVILNPSESEVTINFATNRLSGQKSSPNSPENTGYWAYGNAETQNRNAIRGLRKSLADAGHSGHASNSK